MTLDELKMGKSAVVLSIDKNSDLYQRFIDIGIIENTMIECVLKSPSNNPKAYLIRGAVIAIRNEDARAIKIIEEAKNI